MTARAAWYTICAEGDGNMTIKMRIERYISLANAQYAVANRRGYAVMLGDDNRFWVVTLADAQRLERAGYEWA